MQVDAVVSAVLPPRRPPSCVSISIKDRLNEHAVAAVVVMSESRLRRHCSSRQCGGGGGGGGGDGDTLLTKRRTVCGAASLAPI